MKLVREIARDAVEQLSHKLIEDSFDWPDRMTVDSELEVLEFLVPIIAAKLEPVREILIRTKAVLKDPAVWKQITATEHGVASVFMDVVDAIEMLSEREDKCQDQSLWTH